MQLSDVNALVEHLMLYRKHGYRAILRRLNVVALELELYRDPAAKALNR